jgi:putative tricarboxylic transport membrane protein
VAPDTHRRIPLTKAERVTSLLFIMLAVLIGFESRKYPLGALDNPGPGFLPLLLAVAMAGMSVSLSVKAWKNKRANDSSLFWPEKGGLFKVSVAFLTIILFTALLNMTGYMMNIFFLFLILLRPIGRQRWVWSISIALAATLVSYFLFDKWLMVPLPRGMWFGG